MSFWRRERLPLLLSSSLATVPSLFFSLTPFLCFMGAQNYDYMLTTIFGADGSIEVSWGLNEIEGG